MRGVEKLPEAFQGLSETENVMVCGVCRNRRRASDIVYVDGDSQVAVCSDCAAKISIHLAEWDKECLEKIGEFLKKPRKK